MGRDSGFTLVEVLVAGMVLAFASFGLVGLLRMSDRMAYRAKLDGALAVLVDGRGSLLLGCPFSRFVSLVSTNDPVEGNRYVFQRGLSNGCNFHPWFPFLLPGEGGDLSSTNYLAYGRPLPGQTNARGLFPFFETVTLEFDDVPESAGSVNVVYRVYWMDPMEGGGNNLTFSFVRRNPLLY